MTFNGLGTGTVRFRESETASPTLDFGAYSEPGTYKVVGFYEEDPECFTNMNDEIKISVIQAPTVSVASAPSCLKATVTATAANGSGTYTTYSWKVPAGAKDPGNTASFDTKVEGEYTVTVTDSRKCTSTVVTQSVQIEKPGDSYIGLKSTWIENNTKWKFEVVDEKNEVGDNLIYWERKTPSTEWDTIRVESTGKPYTGITYIENNPVVGQVDIRASALNPTTCVIVNFIFDPSQLPVTMLSFTAQKRGEHVQLKWVTAMERNNTGFEVQVSEDGTTFRALAWVPTQNGNTNSMQTYEYTDTQRGKVGLRYYQLKQIDVDNTSEIFGPVKVDFGNRSAITVSPNPFQNELKLSIDTEQNGQAFIVMTNAVGVHILQQTIKVEKGQNEMPIVLDVNLPSGVYFITVRLGDSMKQFKLLKQ